MLAQVSPWYAHAAPAHSRCSRRTPSPHPPGWNGAPDAGIGPGAEILGRDLCGKRVLELGCGPGHNAAHLAKHHQARVTGVDLVGLQVRRARSHYGQHRRRHVRRRPRTAPPAGHRREFDAIYSVFGAVGLVAPELLLAAISRRLKPGGVLAFSVPHPARAGRHPSTDDRPARGLRHHARPHPTTPRPMGVRRPTAGRSHLSRTGLRVTSTLELRRPAPRPVAHHPPDHRPQTLTDGGNDAPALPAPGHRRRPHTRSRPPTAAPRPPTSATTVLPTGRHPDNPCPSGSTRPRPLLTDLLTSGLVTPVWCTSWRKDAATIIGPLLGLPDFPYLDLPRPQITTSHPNGYLWKRDHVDVWLGRRPRRLDRRRLHRPRPRLGGGAHHQGNGDSPHSARPAPRSTARAPD